MDLSKQQIELAGCLRRLLKSRFLLKSKNEKWFQTIIDLRQEIERAVMPIALTLEVNESLGLAYLKTVSAEAEEAVNFQAGRRRTLTPLASALVYKLRHQRLQFYLNPTNESSPLINTEEMREFLQNFNSAKLDSQFERAFRKTLEELTELQIIDEVRTDSGVFEITALCEVLLNLDQINEMKARMENYFNSDTTTGTDHHVG